MLKTMVTMVSVYDRWEREMLHSTAPKEDSVPQSGNRRRRRIGREERKRILRRSFFDGIEEKDGKLLFYLIRNLLPHDYLPPLLYEFACSWS